MITLNGSDVFCAKCGSTNLNFRDDELMKEYSGTKEEVMIECDRCNSWFSKEFIEANIADFTEPEKRSEIFESRARMYSKYRKNDEVEKDEEEVKREEDVYRQAKIQ